MEIKLYTSHCPKCKVLETKLKLKKADYREITDFNVDELSKMGFSSLPILQVDDKYLAFKEANDFINTFESSAETPVEEKPKVNPLGTFTLDMFEGLDSGDSILESIKSE